MSKRWCCLKLGLMGVVLAVSWSAADAQDAQGFFERTLAIDGPVELDVRTGSGRIVIRPGAAGQVRVAGELRAWSRWNGWWRGGRSAEETVELIRRLESDPPIEVSGNRVRVGHLADEYFRDSRGGVSISYEIEVPAEASIVSRTGSGAQEIRGVTGPVEVSAGSGAIELADVGGPVVARTGSGSVRAHGIRGAFDAHAGSGSITLEQSDPGNVSIATGSGSSDLRGVDGEVRARAGSGRIAVQGTPSGAWDLETGSGSVRLELPADAAFDIDAHTGSGGIETGHPVQIQGRIDRNRLSGQVRGGGPLLRVRTGSGSVRVD